MEEWEYLTIRFKAVGIQLTNPDLISTVELSETLRQAAELSFLNHRQLLDVAAVEGWILFSVAHKEDDMTYFYFKKPAQGDS
jgi:hypothetical protein